MSADRERTYLIGRRNHFETAEVDLRLSGSHKPINLPEGFISRQCRLNLSWSWRPLSIRREARSIRFLDHGLHPAPLDYMADRCAISQQAKLTDKAQNVGGQNVKSSPCPDRTMARSVTTSWKLGDGASIPQCPAVDVPEALQEGHLRALLLQDSALWQEGFPQAWESLNRLEFLVLQDNLLGPAARWAHVVLPTAGFGQQDANMINQVVRLLALHQAWTVMGKVCTTGTASAASWLPTGPPFPKAWIPFNRNGRGSFSTAPWPMGTRPLAKKQRLANLLVKA